MNAKTLLGLSLGIGGFIVSLILPLEGLELSARITLGIFILASVFWIFEPIPIYATSMLIILLQTMFLSTQGVVFSVRFAPSDDNLVIQQDGSMLVPRNSFSSDGYLFLNTSDKSVSKIGPFALTDGSSEFVSVSHKKLTSEARVISDPNHRSIVANAPSYSQFYATLSSPIIMLFLGGFALAAAAVKFGLDRNLTRVLLRPFGDRPEYVCLGLMVCTATLSAFMSNTATTAMMMTVVLPIVAVMPLDDPFRKGVALAIPVAANVGGIATPIGTPPNAVALAALKESGIDISFSTWMAMAVPFAIILLVIAWIALIKLFPPKTERFDISMEGSFNKSPKAIASYVVFAATILLWVTENLHGISTSMVAFLPIAALPVLGVLDKKDIRGFSWEVLWLVGGGISLGLSMKDTGLAEWMIGQVSWSSLGGIGLVVVFGIVGYALSNLISNTVTATMLMPLAITVGAGLAASGDLNLVTAIVSITVIVSCSMILPISTPPNAIAMASGIVETKDMAKSGVVVGLAGFVLAIAMGLFVWPFIVG